MGDLGMTMQSMRDISQVEAELGSDKVWEVPKPDVRKKSEKRQRGAMVSVRLTPGELEEVQTAAEGSGMTVAAYMRDRALRGVRPVRAVHRTAEPSRNATYAPEFSFAGSMVVMTKYKAAYGRS